MKKATATVVSSFFDEARSSVKKAYSDVMVGTEIPKVLDITVSYDGTWLTRGHTSMYGVGCVIDVLTGFVIDYEVMSKLCMKCNRAKKRLSTREFTQWYNEHAPTCDVNHSGSSGAMESEAALKMWRRSEQHGLRYTTVLSDGDASTYKKLCEEKVYGDSVSISKEECVNHIGKRLGTALRNVVSDWRTRGVTLGGRSHGALKAGTIVKLQRYYQKAIISNRGNLHDMKTAIFATLYHSISTDRKPQHSKCPAGPDSWCFYQRALTEGKKPGPHKENVGTPLLESYLAKILPVYQRLASDALLSRCLLCQTQNANESLHSVIWNHFPKTSFGSTRRVKLAAEMAICKFNYGTVKSTIAIQQAAGVRTGQKTVDLATRRDRRRTVVAQIRSTKKFQHYRQAVRLAKIRLQETSQRQEGVSYKPGHF